MAKEIPKVDAPAAAVYRFGAFELRVEDHVVLRDGERVALSPKGFELLRTLVAHHGRVLDKQHLLDTLWPDTFVEEANLSVQMAAVRKALGDGERFIETVAKRGYRFVAPVERVAESELERPATAGAYVSYLRANQLAYETTQIQQAQELYEATVREDPMFAPAWARLGRCYRVIGKFALAGSDAEASFARAQCAFERALALDPSSALAHNLLAQLEVDMGRAEGAMLRLLRLVEKRRHAAPLYAGLVHALRFCGLLDLSVAAHLRARAIDPAIPTSIHHTWWMKGDYARAMSETFGDIGYMPGLALASAGQIRDAVAALKWRERENADLRMAAYIRSLRALLEDKPEESAAAVDAAAVLQFDGEALYYLARTNARLGRHDPFVALMTRVVDGGFCCYDTFAADPWLANMRSVPAVERLLSRAHDGMRHARQAFGGAGGSRLLA